MNFATEPSCVLLVRCYPVLLIPGLTPFDCADRLQTIIAYDRIVVMDAGKINQIGTPLELYGDTTGIFRGMCDRSSIDLEDIQMAVKAQSDFF